MKPGHVHSISLFSDIVIVYTLPELPGTLYVLIGGNTKKGLRLASKSSWTRLLAHSLKFTIYGISAPGKFSPSEFSKSLFVYLLVIAIVSLSGSTVLDCRFGFLRFS